MVSSSCHNCVSLFCLPGVQELCYSDAHSLLLFVYMLISHYLLFKTLLTRLFIFLRAVYFGSDSRQKKSSVADLWALFTQVLQIQLAQKARADRLVSSIEHISPPAFVLLREVQLVRLWSYFLHDVTSNTTTVRIKVYNGHWKNQREGKVETLLGVTTKKTMGNSIFYQMDAVLFLLISFHLQRSMVIQSVGAWYIDHTSPVLFGGRKDKEEKK